MRGSPTNFWETASTIEHVFVMEQRRPALVVPSHCTKGMFLGRGGMAWMNKAARGDSAPAQMALGNHSFRMGDLSTAKTWLEKAAAQGHEMAEVDLQSSAEI